MYCLSFYPKLQATDLTFNCVLIHKKHQVYNIKELAFVQRSSCVVQVVKVWLSILDSLAFSTPALWCRDFHSCVFSRPEATGNKVSRCFDIVAGVDRAQRPLRAVNGRYDNAT